MTDLVKEFENLLQGNEKTDTIGTSSFRVVSFAEVSESNLQTPRHRMAFQRAITTEITASSVLQGWTDTGAMETCIKVDTTYPCSR